MQTDDACYLDHGVSGYGVAVKLHHDRPVEPQEVGDLLREMMDAIARDCVERGAKFIGHIKSHLMCAQGSLKADTIGIGHPAALHGELSGPSNDLYVAINSIVQGITEAQVKEATLGSAHRLAEERGFRVVLEKEHLYFDKYDFASDEEYLEQLEAQFGPEAEESGAEE
ncbi:MAG: hypothetical protein KKA32_18885 [Actinobacteria bacterium]|nr:hypothetical protein [Actinomycetota bacterium]